MALGRHNGVAQDEAGNIQSAATVTVRSEQTGGLVAIKSDRAGATPKSNPFTSDADGTFFFHAPPGEYRIDVVKGAFSRTLRYVPVGLVSGDVGTARLNEANTWTAPQTMAELLDLTSGQIKFPATQNPSSDVNTLDDYEEGGTWTPTIGFPTPGDSSIAYSDQQGTYWKCGRMVVAWRTLTTSTFTFTTAAGALQISGLPFTVAASLGGNNVRGGVFNFEGITKAGYTQFIATALINTQRGAIFASGSGVGLSSVSAADTPSGGTVRLLGVFFYLADA